MTPNISNILDLSEALLANDALTLEAPANHNSATIKASAKLSSALSENLDKTSQALQTHLTQAYGISHLVVSTEQTDEVTNFSITMPNHQLVRVAQDPNVALREAIQNKGLLHVRQSPSISNGQALQHPINSGDVFDEASADSLIKEGEANAKQAAQEMVGRMFSKENIFNFDGDFSTSDITFKSAIPVEKAYGDFELVGLRKQMAAYLAEDMGISGATLDMNVGGHGHDGQTLVASLSVPKSEMRKVEAYLPDGVKLVNYPVINERDNQSIETKKNLLKDDNSVALRKILGGDVISVEKEGDVLVIETARGIANAAEDITPLLESAYTYAREHAPSFVLSVKDMKPVEADPMINDVTFSSRISVYELEALRPCMSNKLELALQNEKLLSGDVPAERVEPDFDVFTDRAEIEARVAEHAVEQGKS